MSCRGTFDECDDPKCSEHPTTPTPDSPEQAAKEWLTRCDWCNWPLKQRVEDGCVEGNCSQRPLPTPQTAWGIHEFKLKRSIRVLIRSREEAARREGIREGVRRAAEVADEWNGQIDHEWSFGDVLLLKFNLITKGKMRRNEKRSTFREAAFRAGAEEAQGERNGIISRLRARWPHIEVPVFLGTRKTTDPGPPTCLRCSIEDEIGRPFHDQLGPLRDCLPLPEPKA